MKLQKFIAADMRDALAQVKRALGSDALIVASRPVRRGLLGNGVEVTAAVDTVEPAPPAADAAPAKAAPVMSDADVERIMMPLRSELRAELRSIRTLLQASTEARREVDPEALASRHVIAAPSERSTIALVGPTGVGKTTTIAKLAARAALIDRRSVAIITLDAFRVGGQDQIRAFADLMGVSLTVTDPERLGDALDELDDQDSIFIDTAGRSPRDPDVIRELHTAFSGRDDVEIHLAMAAGSGAQAIDAAVGRYGRLPIARLLFTKVDEAIALGELVEAPARHRIPVTWLATGQRVPEDLEEATSDLLVEWSRDGFSDKRVAA
jgi:flagellar biosynthesis GTPase FlhF